MHVRREVVGEGDRSEFTVDCRHRSLAHSMNQNFGGHSVAHQIRHRYDFQVVMIGELPEIREPGHSSLVVHHLTDHSGRRQTGNAREIRDRFGLAGPYKDPASPRPQRKYVPGSGQIRRLAARINRHLNRRGPIRGRDSRRDPSFCLDRDAKSGSSRCRIIRFRYL